MPRNVPIGASSYYIPRTNHKTSLGQKRAPSVHHGRIELLLSYKWRTKQLDHNNVGINYLYINGDFYTKMVITTHFQIVHKCKRKWEF